MKHALWQIIILVIIYSFFCASQVGTAYGGEMTDDMKKMQEQLNNQVLSKPFSVADEAQVKSYIEDAQRRGEVPQPYTGKYWRPGIRVSICGHILIRNIFPADIITSTTVVTIRRRDIGVRHRDA